jgi:hypothetical protein
VPEQERNSTLETPLIEFITAQAIQPEDPSLTYSILSVVQSLISLPGSLYSQHFWEQGVLQSLVQYLEIPDPGVRISVLTSMAYAMIDGAFAGVCVQFPLSATLFDDTISEFPQLEVALVKICHFFLWGIPRESESFLDILGFFLHLYSPTHSPDNLFLFLIESIHRQQEAPFPYDFFFDSGFLQTKVGSYINLTEDEIDLDRREAIHYYSVKLCLSCYQFFEHFRENCPSIVLPEVLVSIVQDPGSSSRSTSIAFKLLAEMCQPLETRNWVPDVLFAHGGLRDALYRCIDVGTFSVRLNCLRLCQELLKEARDARSIMFLCVEEFVRSCMDFVEPEIPKLALAAIDALIALFSREEAELLDLPNLASILDIDEYTEKLEDISDYGDLLQGRLGRRPLELLTLKHIRLQEAETREIARSGRLWGNPGPEHWESALTQGTDALDEEVIVLQPPLEVASLFEASGLDLLGTFGNNF